MSPDAGLGDGAASGAGSSGGGLLLVRAGVSTVREWALDGLGPVIVVPDPSG